MKIINNIYFCTPFSDKIKEALWTATIEKVVIKDNIPFHFKDGTEIVL